MNQAFTHEQAEEICEDFEDLVDTELIIDGTKCFVDHVTMLPFAEDAKQAFMNEYNTTRNVQPSGSYSRDEYDVYIIASDITNADNIIAQDIRSYIANNGVGYNFPE